MDTNKCKDCGKPIFSSDQEKERWEKLVASKPDMVMPKRCKDCRAAKKSRQGAYQ